MTNPTIYWLCFFCFSAGLNIGAMLSARDNNDTVYFLIYYFGLVLVLLGALVSFLKL